MKQGQTVRKDGRWTSKWLNVERVTDAIKATRDLDLW